MQNVIPFLWFNKNALPAAKFYVSLFKNSKIHRITRVTSAGPGRKGSVQTVWFRINGLDCIALNGGPQFKFTEAISLVIQCGTQAEIDRLWSRLTARGGKPIQCGWLRDKYGLYWQIVPRNLGKFLGHPTKSARVMEAVFKMKKLDIATMKKAYAGR